MSELFGPIIGITLVLMSVFLPAAFLPGISGQLYRQFALVMAATALLSAINAATLKPTQCALWLRPTPARARQPVSRLQPRLRRRRARLCRPGRAHGAAQPDRRGRRHRASAGSRSGVSPGCRPSFIPIEDQGYVVAGVLLPEGASLERTERVMDRVTKILRAVRRASSQVVAIGGISVLDNNATLANAGAALRDPRAMGRARPRRGPANLAVRQDERGARRDRGGPALVARAAADPGHRQRRGLPDGGRAARQQLRLPEAAERRPGDRRKGGSQSGIERIV